MCLETSAVDSYWVQRLDSVTSQQQCLLFSRTPRQQLSGLWTKPEQEWIDPGCICTCPMFCILENRTDQQIILWTSQNNAQDVDPAATGHASPSWLFWRKLLQKKIKSHEMLKSQRTCLTCHWVVKKGKQAGRAGRGDVLKMFRCLLLPFWG